MTTWLDTSRGGRLYSIQYGYNKSHTVGHRHNMTNIVPNKATIQYIDMESNVYTTGKMDYIS